MSLSASVISWLGSRSWWGFTMVLFLFVFIFIYIILFVGPIAWLNIETLYLHINYSTNHITRALRMLPLTLLKSFDCSCYKFLRMFLYFCFSLCYSRLYILSLSFWDCSIRCMNERYLLVCFYVIRFFYYYAILRKVSSWLFRLF